MSEQPLRGTSLLVSACVAFMCAAVVAAATFVTDMLQRAFIISAGNSQNSLLLIAAGTDMKPEYWDSGDWRYFLFLVVLISTARWAAATADLRRPLALSAGLGVLLALHSGGTLAALPAARLFHYGSLAAVILLGQKFDGVGRFLLLPLLGALLLTVSNDKTLFGVVIKAVEVELPGSVLLRFLDFFDLLAWVYGAIACHAWAMAPKRAPAGDSRQAA